MAEPQEDGVVAALDDGSLQSPPQQNGQRRAKRPVDSAAARAVAEDPEPWDDTVDGAELVATLEGVFTRYLVLAPGMPLVLALWTIATWLADAFDAFPYLVITSPQKRCGKSRVLELLEFVCRRSLSAANISEAALFRVIEMETPALLIDEAQHLRIRDERSAALHDLLCAGFRKGSYAIRMGGQHHDEVRKFRVYGPKAIALIGKMTDVLMDRAIEVPMRRHKAGERVDRFFRSQVQISTATLRRQLVRWAGDHEADVARIYVETPLSNGLTDREAELWMPVFAVARAAAPARLDEIERTAARLSGSKADGEDSLGVRLLGAIHAIVDGRDFLPSKDLVAALVAIEDAPWSEYRAGKSITAKGLADLLRPFGVEPGKARYEDQVGVRGYFRQAFQDAGNAMSPPFPVLKCHKRHKPW